MDSICDSASQPLKLDLMITFNLVVRLGLMTSWFDRYNIKIILVKWDKDLVTKIKMHIFKVKLPFYPPCEVKYGLQNGVSTVSWKVLLFITRWRSWSFLVTKPYGAQTQQLLQEIGQTKFPVTLFFTLVKFCSCATFYGP